MIKPNGLDKHEALLDRCRMILAGNPPNVQGAVIADLLAIWVHGHRVERPGEARKLRDDLLALEIAAAMKLVDYYDQCKAVAEAEEATRQ